MNIITKNIPNIITLANLFFGLCAIIFASQDKLEIASFCIFIGALLDFTDGLAARLLNANGDLGKQLDSLADMVTFGVAPAIILFHHVYQIKHNITLKLSTLNGLFFPEILALLIPIFSAIRLAKFNIETKETDSFIGLPTPALAILIASIPIINTNVFPIFINLEFLVVISIFTPILLVAKIPVFSLKFNKREAISSNLNILRIILFMTSIILLFLIDFAAIPFIVILYLTLSIINNLIK